MTHLQEVTHPLWFHHGNTTGTELLTIRYPALDKCPAFARSFQAVTFTGEEHILRLLTAVDALFSYATKYPNAQATHEGTWGSVTSKNDGLFYLQDNQKNVFPVNLFGLYHIVDSFCTGEHSTMQRLTRVVNARQERALYPPTQQLIDQLVKVTEDVGARLNGVRLRADFADTTARLIERAGQLDSLNRGLLDLIEAYGLKPSPKYNNYDAWRISKIIAEAK
jgi:hypothetical protein